jgi:adenylate cyclase
MMELPSSRETPRHPFTLEFPESLEAEFQETHFRNSLATVRMLTGVGALLYGMVFLVFDRFALPGDVFEDVAVIRLSVLVILLGALGFTWCRVFRRWWQPTVAISILVVAGSVAIMVVRHPSVGMFRDVIAAAFLLYLMVTFVIARLRFVPSVLTAVGLAVIYNLAMIRIDSTDPQSLAGNNMMLLSGILLGMLAAYQLERHVRSDFMHARLLDAERRKSEALLLNILPSTIAARLKRSPGTIADRHADVTVLFADLRGFTPLAAKLSPEESVTLLNRIFSSFDRIADRYGVEKIKTIGDAYMVAGGLIRPAEDHAESVADLALDFRAEIETLSREFQEPLSIRIGIHTGPVVAGVLGLRKFTYDLWGDTVNLASRMESHGVPGQIQVTESVRQRLAGSFAFEPRGDLEVKGRGTMRTYFLLGRLESSRLPETS